MFMKFFMFLNPLALFLIMLILELKPSTEETGRVGFLMISCASLTGTSTGSGNERIKIGLNNRSPREYRTELGLALYF